MLYPSIKNRFIKTQLYDILFIDNFVYIEIDEIWGANMKLKIDWGEPIIKEDDIMQIQPSDLDDFYVAQNDLDKTNLFFILLTSIHHYLDKEEQEKSAHLCFLTAYYLFITLTPPGSCKLAMHYIKQAVDLNPLEEYKEWVPLIEKGN